MKRDRALLLRRFFCAALLATTIFAYALAQDADASGRKIVSVQALFEYPVAPDSLSLEGKAKYLLENFWNDMDFKQKTVDQAALNHAFDVFVAPMRWASDEVISKQVDLLLKKVEKNPGLTYQFLRAAEHSLYSNDAELWIDEVYIRFIRAALKNKKIGERLKERYRRQLSQLEGSAIGKPVASFTYTDASGTKQTFRPSALMDVVVFADPFSVDAMLKKVQLDTSEEVSKAIADNKIRLLYILTAQPDAATAPSLAAHSIPENWSAGVSDDALNLIDIRIDPDVYVIDPSGNILHKHLRADDAIFFAGIVNAEDNTNQ